MHGIAPITVKREIKSFVRRHPQERTGLQHTRPPRHLPSSTPLHQVPEKMFAQSGAGSKGPSRLTEDSGDAVEVNLHGYRGIENLSGPVRGGHDECGFKFHRFSPFIFRSTPFEQGKNRDKVITVTAQPTLTL